MICFLTDQSYSTLCLLANFYSFPLLFVFFKIDFFSKISLRNTIRLSNSLDPDQVRHLQTTIVGRQLSYFSGHQVTISVK